MGAENLKSSIKKSGELHEKLEAAIRHISEQYPPSHFPVNTKESFCFSPPKGQGGRLQLESCEFSHCSCLEFKSLVAIRDALQVFQEWLRFLERLETRQNVERCATLVRFEQSRQFLVRRLVEHNGRDFPVIQQTLEFAWANGIVANLSSKASSIDKKSSLQKNHAAHGVKFSKGFVSFINSSFQVMKKPLKLQKAAGMILRLGVAAAGMLLVLQLQQRSQTSLKLHKMVPKTNVSRQKEGQFFMNSTIGGTAQQIWSSPMDVSYGRG